ncbi:MAG TPA: hypothetical protein VFX25_16145, partial [Streptosporangiaceae bacterium]|nr:hypothetical protein [Streptosporangiaceae bacterium]
MSASPAPADPGWDDDLAWLDRDPMTAAEREASLDRVCEQDEGHLWDEEEFGDVEPFTPDEVLAADQRITAWARELRKAGLEGGMDVLRARAFLDLLLGKDSRPRRPRPGQ